MSTQQLTVGDRVADRVYSDDVTPMRVVDPNVGTADDVTVDGTPISEIDSNAQFPDDDVVVTIVFESELEHNVPGWEERLGSEFHDKLEAYSDEWSVDIQMYHYPQSRLVEIVESLPEDSSD